ncbi:MAG: hypothetical protein WCO78_03685 [Candidatus Roizmanbacteria bacterium]
MIEHEYSLTPAAEDIIQSAFEWTWCPNTLCGTGGSKPEDANGQCLGVAIAASRVFGFEVRRSDVGRLNPNLAPEEMHFFQYITEWKKT